MELSIFLAKVLGLYLVIIGIAVWLKRKEIGTLALNFSQDKTHIYFSGIIFLLLGLSLVISHNVWNTPWQSVITILGWITLFKAGIRMFFPEKVGPLATKTTNSGWYRFVILAFFIIGLWLTYMGFSYGR